MPITFRQTPPDASATETERRINALIAPDPRRQREPLPTPVPRAPISASVGVADFGESIATEAP